MLGRGGEVKSEPSCTLERNQRGSATVADEKESPLSPRQRPAGPGNPHPLATLKTELVWEGKYDEYGNRREVDVAGAVMPLQKIETVDEPRARTEAQGRLFNAHKAHLDDFRNMLIWGDNKLVGASLLRHFKGKIDLIYIDPPFDVGADFSLYVPIGSSAESVLKDQSTLEMVAYRDMWGRGTDSYLHSLFERFVLMRELLSERAHIVVHLAPTVSYHVRCIMDAVFGSENFRSEIIVHRPISKNLQRQFDTVVALPQGHDTLLWYSSRPESRVKNLLIPYEAKDAEGYWHRFWSGADRPTMRYELLGETPSHGQWKWERDRALRAVDNYQRFLLDAHGKPLVEYWRETGCELEFVRKSGTGAVENWYSPSSDKVADTVWDDMKAYENLKDFPTQKHRDLLARLIGWLSADGDLVADLFCGSGTTGVVAEMLGRRWIMCDLGRFGIHTSRKRLIDMQRALHESGKAYRAFDVYNLGRYERQWWQKESLKGADEEHRRVVLEFFKAEVLESAHASSPLIHGRKGRALCHVDGIDSVFNRDEAKAVARAVAQAGARECYCLAWEFEMDLRLTTAAIEKELGIALKLIQIPREIMEKNRKSPPPFLEMAVLEAEAVMHSRTAKGEVPTVDIKLTRFLPSLAEVPTKELEAIKERAMKSGFDFIDFWAIDFDWHPDQPFKHHWQDYRTRKDRSLRTVSNAAFAYPKNGTYTACVKVVDTFGCDTSVTVEVRL